MDTNIISELGKPTPNTNVIALLNQLEDAYLSMITVHEIECGLNLLPEGKRRNQLTAMMQQLLLQYDDFIVPIDQRIAHQSARLRAKAHQAGRVLHMADSLIAGTAIVMGGLIIVTRNVKDFEGFGLELIDPFSGSLAHTINFT